MLLADVDVTDSVQRGLNEIFAFIPELIMALVIVAVGYIVAKALGNLVGRALHRGGLDHQLHRGSAGTWVQKVTGSPSRLLGTIAFWALFLGAISLAVSVLGVNALTEFVAAVYGYLPNVIAALLIFIVAGIVAAGVATLASRFFGGTALGKIVSTAGPILVMTIATFMILDQLKIAEDIVVITYAALLGAVALGSALAFGLGGRDVARRMLEGAYEKGQERRDEFRTDLERGMSRARQEAGEARSRVQDGGREPAYAGSAVRERDTTTVMPSRDTGATPSATGFEAPVDPQRGGGPGTPAFEEAYEPADEPRRGGSS
jgi:hypothetical protein